MYHKEKLTSNTKNVFLNCVYLKTSLVIYLLHIMVTITPNEKHNFNSDELNKSGVNIHAN